MFRQLMSEGLGARPTAVTTATHMCTCQREAACLWVCVEEPPCNDAVVASGKSTVAQGFPLQLKKTVHVHLLMCSHPKLVLPLLHYELSAKIAMENQLF